jgi:hypothetical protein
VANKNVRGSAYFSRVSEHCANGCGRLGTGLNSLVGALAGIKPALLSELDFEWSASTASATGAFALSQPKKSPGGEAVWSVDAAGWARLQALFGFEAVFRTSIWLRNGRQRERPLRRLFFPSG